MTLMNLPKVEIDIFSGDPMQYHTFIASFDQNVDKILQSDQLKLTRLLQYTNAEAKEEIPSCALIGGEKGYEKTRTILHDRFGNDHLLADHIINKLQDGKPVRSAKDILQLADDFVSGREILSQINKLQELESQRSIIQIEHRLQPFFQTRGKKYALKYVQESS